MNYLLTGLSIEADDDDDDDDSLIIIIIVFPHYGR